MVKVISLMVVILSLNSCSSAVSVGAFIGNAGTSSKGIKTSFSDTYLKTKVLYVLHICGDQRVKT